MISYLWWCGLGIDHSQLSDCEVVVIQVVVEVLSNTIYIQERPYRIFNINDALHGNRMDNQLKAVVEEQLNLCTDMKMLGLTIS